LRKDGAALIHDPLSAVPAAQTSRSDVQIAARSKQTQLITGPSLAVGTPCFSRTAVVITFGVLLKSLGVQSGRGTEFGTWSHLLRKLWWHDEGQDIAEYAVMLGVILVLVVGTIRLIGSNMNNAFSATASSIQ